MEILKARVPRRLGGVLRLLVIALAGLSISSVGQDLDEYAVKAAFLYNFTKFVEWPEPGDAPFFTICILGDDPFESAIDRLTMGKTVRGRPFQVRRLKEETEGKQCQIVFTRSAEMGKAARLLDSTRGAPVLTVGESQEFVRMGGMVFLSMENKRVTVVINKTATDNAGLKVSAQLMTLAKVYKP